MDVSLPGMFAKVTQAIHILRCEYKYAIVSNNLILPSNHLPLEVVLEAEDLEKDSWKYYVVHHASRHLLWFCDYKLTTNVYQGAESEAHVGESFVNVVGNKYKTECTRRTSIPG